MPRRALAALAFALVASAAAAAPISAYSGLVVFGDSLSDPGNLPDGARPPAPYADGRYSNGAVWAEYFGARFNAVRNYAQGGAKATTDATPDGRDDFAAQISAFAADAPALGARPLASIWFGANDLFALTPGGDPRPVISAALGALGDGIGRLYGLGVRDLVVFNLPNIGVTPDYAGDPAQSAALTAVSAGFNSGLDQTLAAAAALPGLEITRVDAFALISEVFANPAAFGLDPAKKAARCIDGAPGSLPACAGYAFFDSVHPTTQMHALVAERAASALVPLPMTGWMMLAALGALGLASRRR